MTGLAPPHHATSRRHRRRLGHVAAGLVTIVTAGCGVAPDDGPEKDPGCGECTREAAAVARQVRQVDGVRKLSFLAYVPGKSIRLNPTLTLDAFIDAGSLDRVRPAIVKAAWDSRITPLEEITLNVKTPDGRLTELRFRFVKGTREYAAYRDAWGPRPVD